MNLGFGQLEKNLTWLRREIIAALAANDDLFDLLVFKGGNALSLAHNIGMRASLDLDYSLSAEVSDTDHLGHSIHKALFDHLSRYGLTAFDWRFTHRPKTPKLQQDPQWGGFAGTFKVIPTDRWQELKGHLEHSRKEAWGITAGGGSARTFTIELSKNEYCDGAEEVQIKNGFTIRVYTPAMIAAEKLRAICQQMQEYEYRSTRAPRARDFYDIHAVISEANVNLSSEIHLELIRQVFRAKRVPLILLQLVERDLPFHEQSWDEVRNAIPAGKPMDFHFYSSFVVGVIKYLEPLWVEDAPR